MLTVPLLLQRIFIHSVMHVTHIGRYEVIRVLGKGAMGVVYEAQDPRLARAVAVKTIRAEARDAAQAAAYEARFQTEARSVARLNHPNIVSVFDSGQSEDTTYLVMELVTGVNLKHCLHHGVRFTPWGAVRIALDVLAALGHAHAQKILHRDIKPENILLDANGWVKLTDFGIAKILDAEDDNGTQVSGHSIGTPRYMSPEQVRGLQLDERSDLFSAGVMLFELLTARLPFDGSNQYAVAAQILNETPVRPSSLNPAVPAELDAVLAQAMAKHPADRFQTAREFGKALLASATVLGGGDLTEKLTDSASLVEADSAGMLRWLQSRAAGVSNNVPRVETPGSTDATELSSATMIVQQRHAAPTADRADSTPPAQATGSHVLGRNLPVPAPEPSLSGSQTSAAASPIATQPGSPQHTGEVAIESVTSVTRRPKRWLWSTAGVMMATLAIGGWWVSQQSEAVLPLSAPDAPTTAPATPSVSTAAAPETATGSKTGATPASAKTGSDRPAAMSTQETSDTARGVIAQVPNAQLIVVDVKEASDLRLLNRQVTVRLRGIAPASRSGKAQRDKMQLEALLLGQQVTLNPCTRAGKELLCDAQVSRNRQGDTKHDVGDLLVANGLASRQRP